MGLLKIVILCTALILSACNQGSRSGEKNPIKKTDVNRTCVPESELLAGNIVGGQVVQPSDADAKAVMMLVSDGQLCTAVAIDKKILLTAAHCIAGNKNNTYVSFHSSVSCESGYNKNQHIRGVSETIVHEDYVPTSSEENAENIIADIALVVLEEEIPAGYAIYKIANPDKINDLNNLYLYGFGRAASSGGGAGMLRKTMLNRALYRVDFSNKKVEINQTGGSGICQGDSGGPSFVNVEGEMQILGINSYVRGPKKNICSEYSYETLADSFKEWITYKLLAYKNSK